MLKQIIIYLILSIVVVFFSHYVYLGLIYLNTLVTYLIIKFKPLFAWTSYSYGLSKTLVLIFIPILITLIPALIYRLYKNKPMPYFIAIAWCIWWVLVLTFALLR